MSSAIRRLNNLGLIQPPPFLVPNVMYETIMGSEAYGVSSGDSDKDVYGFCIPTKELIFPHLAGEIYGFGRQKQRFDQWQQHHVEDSETGKIYDMSIYSIVKYVSLVMENNPNMVDSLYTPEFCVLSITEVGRMIREKRDIFLHKGSYHKFRGYAFSQLKKAKDKKPEGKRKEAVDKFGWDPKYLYHLARLCDEAEQILEHGTIDLQRSREYLKAIRRGDVSLEHLERWFAEKEVGLEKLYHESKLRYSPDEDQIKQLLLDCLEHHYGDLSKAVVIEGRAERILGQIKELVSKY